MKKDYTSLEMMLIALASALAAAASRLDVALVLAALLWVALTLTERWERRQARRRGRHL